MMLNIAEKIAEIYLYVLVGPFLKCKPLKKF